MNNSEMVKLKNNTISLKISANFLPQSELVNAIEKKLIDTYSRPLKVIVSVEESTTSLDS